MPDLDPDGRRVELRPDVRLTTPGLSGTVELLEAGQAGSRGEELSPEAYRTALERAGVTEDYTIEISEHTEDDPSPGSRGGTRAESGSDDMVLEVPDPGRAYGQVLLYQAEDFSLSWHLADELTAGVGRENASRGSGTLTYRVPRTVVPTDDVVEPTGQRGVVGALGKKLLKVLAFKILDRAGQEIGDKLGRLFEDQHRPHGFVTLDWTDAGLRSTPLLDRPGSGGLDRFTTGRTLLLVHGTTSTTRNAFGSVPAAVLDELGRRYDGRILALDHPTVAYSPLENVAWLDQQLAVLGERRLEVDVVSHSRGGLVSRLIAEQPGLTSGRVDVKRLVMVASPNAGTALADSAHLDQLLNRLTSLLQLVPSNGVTDSLDVILAVVKQLAIGAFKGLDGIASMNPAAQSDTFLRARMNLPATNSTQYFAAAANFEPAAGSPLFSLTRARDGLTDLVFGGAGNDLVVPTDGVHTVPGLTGRFPVTDRLVFDTADAIDHSGYWPKPRFTDFLLSALPRA